MTDFPAYSGPLSECIKCENYDAHTEWIPSDDILMRRCKRCGYRWLEEPLG